MNLISAFAGSVQKHRTKTALYWGEQEFSFDQLWHESRIVAERLEGTWGLRPEIGRPVAQELPGVHSVFSWHSGGPRRRRAD